MFDNAVLSYKKNNLEKSMLFTEYIQVGSSEQEAVHHQIKDPEVG